MEGEWFRYRKWKVGRNGYFFVGDVLRIDCFRLVLLNGFINGRRKDENEIVKV